MRRVRFNLNKDKSEGSRDPPCSKKVALPVVPTREVPTRSVVSLGVQVFPLGLNETTMRPSRLAGASEPRNRDRDVIYNWLRQILFQEYTDRFLNEGYDLLTITRMTSADLVALGIKHPVHRRHLRSHIEALQLPDLLPSHVPASIEKWMHFLRLDEYVPAILAHGYRKVTDVTALEWEDLEDLSIVKMGHQKKLLMGIERIKSITSARMATRRLSCVVEWPQPIEYVTISWRSLASVTHRVPPPDGPYHAFTTFRTAPPPQRTYTLMAAPAEEQSEDNAGATALVSTPSIEDMHDPCVLDRVEEMLAILIQELDTMFEDQMYNI